ncbi:MAG: hypothetical protein EOO61_02230 [Hymenobacter sp.]|nr:MAG: hypothetical protein EOO61_02230 [Hymenobacter sp.]
MKKQLYILLLLLSSFAFGQNQVRMVTSQAANSVRATRSTAVNAVKAALSITITSPNTGEVNTNGVFELAIAGTQTRASVGVFNADGSMLATIASNVDLTQFPVVNGKRIYKAQWNGLLDDGVTPAAFGNYTISVLSNNVQAQWEGGVGNTTNRSNINTSYSGIATGGIAVSGTTLAYGEAFVEGSAGGKVFRLNDIQNASYPGVANSLINRAIATDGINFYWAATDYYTFRHNDLPLNAIFATRIADNTPVAFSAGVAYNTGQGNRGYDYFIGASLANSKAYSDITVQQNGNWLIASSSESGYLSFFNKTSGAKLNEQAFGKPFKIALTNTAELWVLDADTKIATKYTVADGYTLSPAGVTISGLSDPENIKVSPDNSTVAVLDAGTEQIKFYSNATGALVSTFGKPGGYAANGPLVTYDKFDFRETAQFAYQPDGSFWISDDGIKILRHYAADNAFIEQTVFIPALRSMAADPNNPSRVFARYCEYQIDYSKPLDNGTNGSWKLYKYWGAGKDNHDYVGFTRTVTLPNGFTYGVEGTILYVLDDAVGTRTVSSSFYGTLEADGSLWNRSFPNSTAEIYKQAQTGTSGNGMPTWGSSQLVVKTPALTPKSPFYYRNNTVGASTNAGRYFFFNPNNNNREAGLGDGVSHYGLGYHMGAIKTGGSTWDWQGASSTRPDYYGGDYPRDGTFDIGNNDYQTQHSENCQVLVHGKYIISNVNAEFWRTNYVANNGVNIWNLFYENGLPVVNFGVTSSEAKLFLSNAGNAGNTFSTADVEVDGNIYIWHGDESQWGWAHRWKVSGLNTIAVQSIPVTISAGITMTADPADLMAGLPDLNPSFTGNSRWIIRYPAGGTANVGQMSYLKGKTDIQFGGNGKQVMDCDLKNTAALSSWKISGLMNFGLSGQPKVGGDNYNYLEVLDASGKLIYYYSDEANAGNGYFHSTYVNNVLIKDASNGSYPFASLDNKAFEFRYAGGVLSFRYQYYNKGEVITKTISSVWEQGADATRPAFLRISQGSPGNQTHIIDLSRLRFTTGAAAL